MERMNVTDLLSGIGGFVSVERMSTEDMSYISFDGSKRSHCCEHMSSGYESGFCNDVLYFVQANDDAPTQKDSVHRFNGWTYTCDTHLLKTILSFASTMEEKHLDSAFSEWEDQERKKEERENKLQHCYICGSDGSEHNWETHVAEMKAAQYDG